MPFPKFPRLQAEVAVILKYPWNRRGIPQKWQHLGAVNSQRRIVTADFVLTGIQSRQECGQAGSTKGRWDIPMGKQHSLTRQTIEMRRLHHLVPHEAVVGPAHVIPHDHDDIRGLLGG